VGRKALYSGGVSIAFSGKTSLFVTVILTFALLGFLAEPVYATLNPTTPPTNISDVCGDAGGYFINPERTAWVCYKGGVYGSLNSESGLGTGSEIGTEGGSESPPAEEEGFLGGAPGNNEGGKCALLPGGCAPPEGGVELEEEFQIEQTEPTGGNAPTSLLTGGNAPWLLGLGGGLFLLLFFLFALRRRKKEED